MADLDIRGLYTFPQNSLPLAPMILAPDGSFYGPASGDNGDGLESGGFVYRITRSGEYSVVHQFDRPSVEVPEFNPNGTDVHGPMMVDAEGNLYGMAKKGGEFGAGTIFSITPTGVYKVLTSFRPDSHIPLVLHFRAANGDLYGTGYDAEERQFITKIAPDGTETVVFTLPPPEYYVPPGSTTLPFWITSITMGADGRIYGTASHGGQHDPDQDGVSYGAVFKIETNGELTILAYGSKRFASPSLIQEIQPGVFLCLASGQVVLPPDGGGVLRLTSQGESTLLKTFDSRAEGFRPSTIIVGSDGNYYGATSAGGTLPDGSEGNGTYFKLTPSGEYSTLEVFGSEFYPGRSLLADGGDGFLYGVATMLPVWNPRKAARSNGDELSLRAPVSAPRRAQKNRFFRFKISEAADGNRPPTAKSDVRVLRRPKSGKTVPLKLPVLANDRDPNRDKLTIASVGVPKYGSVTLSADAKSIVYTPGTTFATDTFSYTVSDGRGGSASTQVLLRRHAAGQYQASLKESPGSASVGSLQVMMSALGNFKGTLVFHGERVRFHGELGLDDAFRGAVQFRLGAIATVEFRLDASGEQVLVGSVTAGDTVAEFQAR